MCMAVLRIGYVMHSIVFCSLFQAYVLSWLLDMYADMCVNVECVWYRC